MGVAVTALVIAVGGTAAAASHLLNGDKLIKRASLSGNRLRRHTITARELNISRLGPIPSALRAAHATTATEAMTADAIGRITYRTAMLSVPPNARASGTATCPARTYVAGGGDTSANEDGTSFNYTDLLVDSHPTADRTGWQVTVENDDPAATHVETLWAVCIAASSTG